MHIESVGQGRALVLIHGWAMHSGLLAPLTRALSGHFRVYLADLPGHGRSRDDTDLSLDHVIDRILDTVPDGAIWGGWSLGGLFALTAAQRHPERVGGLIGIATNPCFVRTPDWEHGVPAQVFSGFAAGLREDFDRTVERFLALEALGSARATALLRELYQDVMAHGPPTREALQRGLELLQHSDARPDVARLRQPSLWFAGRRDRLVPAPSMQWCARTAARSRLLELDSGHMPFLGHAPVMAEAVIETFA